MMNCVQKPPGSDTIALAINGTSVQNLPGYGYQQLASVALGGFGGAQVDHQWTFTAPDAARFTLDWNFAEPSASLDALTIDTRTVVPEPAALSGLIGVAALLMRRRRTPIDSTV